MNLSADLLNGFTMPVTVVTLSSVRMTVVPTAQILLLASLAELIKSAVSSSMMICSLSILCLVRSSTLMFRNNLADMQGDVGAFDSLDSKFL